MLRLRTMQESAVIALGPGKDSFSTTHKGAPSKAGLYPLPDPWRTNAGPWVRRILRPWCHSPGRKKADPRIRKNARWRRSGDDRGTCPGRCGRRPCDVRSSRFETDRGGGRSSTTLLKCKVSAQRLPSRCGCPGGKQIADVVQQRNYHQLFTCLVPIGAGGALQRVL